MTTAAAVLTGLACLVLILFLLSLRLSGLTRRVKTLVTVHTKDQQSIQGVLLGSYRDVVVLGHPTHLDHAPDVTLSGDAIIPRGNVAWIQGAAE